jgi:hypothetical protein
MAGKRTPRALTTRAETFILIVRGERVILDSDLASIYGVTTKRLNEQVRRNARRFPEDFFFRLTNRDLAELRSLQVERSLRPLRKRSQNATASKRNIRYLPYAFTEHGAIMAANVLRSRRAADMSVFVVRAFIKMRRMLMVSKEMMEKLEQLENKLTERLDSHERGILFLLEEIRKLMNPSPLPLPKRRPIGFGRDSE